EITLLRLYMASHRHREKMGWGAGGPRQPNKPHHLEIEPCGICIDSELRMIQISYGHSKIQRFALKSRRWDIQNQSLAVEHQSRRLGDHDRATQEAGLHRSIV